MIFFVEKSQITSSLNNVFTFWVLLFFKGSIVNRFSKDTGSMDDVLPPVLFDPIWVKTKKI